MSSSNQPAIISSSYHKYLPLLLFHIHLAHCLTPHRRRTQAMAKGGDAPAATVASAASAAASVASATTVNVAARAERLEEGRAMWELMDIQWSDECLGD